MERRDGNRVKSVLNGVTTYYVDTHFEWTGSTSTMIKYYYAGGQRVAMRVGSNAPSFLLGDHLGSTAITASSTGSKVAELRYHPWGGTRYTSGTTPTSYQYTLRLGSGQARSAQRRGRGRQSTPIYEHALTPLAVNVQKRRPLSGRAPQARASEQPLHPSVHASGTAR